MDLGIKIIDDKRITKKRHPISSTDLYTKYLKMRCHWKKQMFGPPQSVIPPRGSTLMWD